MEANSRALYQALNKDLTGVLNSKFEGPQVEAAAALQRSLLKKFEDDSTGAADELAIAKFLSVNERCERFKFEPMHEWEWMMLGTVKQFLHYFFHPTGVGSILDWPSVFQHAKAGPGASIGARGEDFYTKHFDSTLTYTRKARFLVSTYQRCLRDSTWWKSAEILRQSRYGFAEVEGSRLSTVPKNVDISRTTCTEPSLNMFFQLGYGGTMVSRLREWGLDIDSQATLNKELARVGSLDGTFGTIDLSSASDSLSLNMLRYMLPQDIFMMLWTLRCDKTDIPGKGPVELHMLSTMGNGYTFPLQTALFTCVVLAVYECMGIKHAKSVQGHADNWAVFGDDIIVKREAYGNVCRILQLLGFEVNSEKSFNEGPFRESCGADWHSGTNIRGVYCKSLVTVGARFSLINRLLQWSSRHGILLTETIKYLLQTVPVVKVPLLEDEDAGVRVPYQVVNDQGQSHERTTYTKWAKYGPKLRFNYDSGELGSPKGLKLRKRRLNEAGLVVCMLQGSFTGGMISLRARARDDKYHRCRAKTDYWDALTRVAWSTDQAGPGRLRFFPVMEPGEWQCWSSTVVTQFAMLRQLGT